MSSRYRVTVQYDGSEFFGWQSQLNHRTVQGDLEAALAVLNSGNRVVVTGAGRTDTGVHALGQVAHFDLNTQLSESELCRALNGNLKEDVRIRDCEVTDADFNARFSAKRRSYVYTCRTDDYILDRNYVWPVRGVDLSILDAAAGIILGEHDFTTFCKLNQELAHQRCIVYHSLWKQSKSVLTYEVVANRFLHHMVRYLVGTMMEAGRNRLSLNQFKDMLETPQVDKKIFRAPAKGLILKEVVY